MDMTLNTTYATKNGAYLLTMQNRHGLETYVIYKHVEENNTWIEIHTFMDEQYSKTKLYELVNAK